MISSSAMAATIALTEWDSRNGRRRRWLESKTIMAIEAYREHHRVLIAEDPEHAEEIEEQLALALYSQLHYAVHLAERSMIE